MPKLRKHENKTAYICPACNEEHEINDSWQIEEKDGIVNISPSILFRAESFSYPEKNRVCHSFVKNNKIEYLNDCTHKMAGMTVDMVDYDA